MHTITLNVNEAKRLADGALAAATKDEIMPAIHAAQLTRSADGRVAMIATDRYRVHRMFTDELGPAPHTAPGGYPAWDEVSTILPYGALKWLSANAKKLGHYATVVIDVVPWESGVELGSIGISVRTGLPNDNGLILHPEADGYLGYGGRPVPGSFPPVGRLFAALEPATEVEERGILLEVDFLADLRVLKRNPGKRGDPVRIRMSKPSAAGKAQAVRFEFAHEGKVFADALIMPNLDLRS